MNETNHPGGDAWTRPVFSTDPARFRRAAADAGFPPDKGETAEELLYRIAAGVWMARRRLWWIAAAGWVVAGVALLVLFFGFVINLEIG